MWRAACRELDSDLFFLGDDQGRDDEEQLLGREVCASCPVQLDCLSYAMKHRIRQGLWGGKTSVQRDKIYYRRRKPEPAAIPTFVADAVSSAHS